MSGIRAVMLEPTVEFSVTLAIFPVEMANARRSPGSGC